MKREDTLPEYTCSACVDLLHLLRNLSFHRKSTNRHGTFLKARVTLSILSLPVLVILNFIIFLTTKANFPNIFSSFRGFELHYTHFLQRKPLLVSCPQPVWFYQHIINLLQINHTNMDLCFCFSCTSRFSLQDSVEFEIQIKTMLHLSHTNCIQNCTYLYIIAINNHIRILHNAFWVLLLSRNY